MDKLKVDVDTLFMVARRLANQMPVRYFLYAGPTDKPTSIMRLELWFRTYENPNSLHAELEKLGFVQEGRETNRFYSNDNNKADMYIVRTYTAERMEGDAEK